MLVWCISGIFSRCIVLEVCVSAVTVLMGLTHLAQSVLDHRAWFLAALAVPALLLPEHARGLTGAGEVVAPSVGAALVVSPGKLCEGTGT